MAATLEAINQFRQSLEIRRQLILTKPLVMVDNIPCEIDEVDSALNKVGLKNVNVTHILTVACKLPPAHLADFIYKVLYVADRETTNLKQHFNECFDFIDEAKRNGGHVLVHRKMGISRRFSRYLTSSQHCSRPSC
ncbi:putative phosphoric monoester hydrolase [Medicago truncatula]|uniref:Putative phosphoric monoester hydrolase n=1 Tax=Medicago truncatula TaxID=3880 RepID=A0A396GA77_MEDTR|nr:putative phosphoric monoester hydrolase [Medicago truncatula]